MLREQGTAPCIPPRRSRNKAVHGDKRPYTMGHKIENLLSRLKEWRPRATGHDRCGSIFGSAMFLAPTAIFCLWVLTLENVGLDPKDAPGHGARAFAPVAERC